MVLRHGRLCLGMVVLLLAGCTTAGSPEFAHGANHPGNESLHAFYYAWYGNPETDGAWRQWNHQILLKGGSGGRHQPPEDIGASFYPRDGLYSSNDPVDLDRQMRQMGEAGIGVVVATWWGRDDFTDKAMPLLLDAAARHGIKVCFHIEPFPGRTAETTREALAYLLERHGGHPALYRPAAWGGRPVAYIYDSYLISPKDWAEVLQPGGESSIRGTRLDAVMIGLWVKEGDGAALKRAGFDGFYTYFAVDGFVYGSTPANWPVLDAFAAEHGMFFVPCVGPGYDDLRIRPWNGKNQRARENGAYYDRMFEAAVALDPPAIGLTSWNEWHEGTQLEPAMPKAIEGYRYLDYEGRPPDWYIGRTRYWLERWKPEGKGE